jgi:hypothetical protein
MPHHTSAAESKAGLPAAGRAAPLIPGWTVWQSPGTRQWHARKDGSDPALVLHDDTLDGLRAQARICP